MTAKQQQSKRTKREQRMEASCQCTLFNVCKTANVELYCTNEKQNYSQVRKCYIKLSIILMSAIQPWILLRGYSWRARRKHPSVHLADPENATRLGQLDRRCLGARQRALLPHHQTHQQRGLQVRIISSIRNQDVTQIRACGTSLRRTKQLIKLLHDLIPF